MIISRSVEPMRSFIHSLRRDWKSWSRVERISALGLLLGAPLLAILALAHTLGGYA
ncbi:MAG TPA: hypothetical protein VD978_19960 [Azospirillum sp.]|nr:hypothetical protein [Azospirillum sp.]